LILIVLCLAVYRVTRLLTRDQIPLVAVPREKIKSWAKTNGHDAVAYLVTCDWCVSMWTSGVLVLGLGVYVARGLHQSWWPWPLWLGVWLAASAVAGLITVGEGNVEAQSFAARAQGLAAATAQPTDVVRDDPGRREHN
jgi:hypothetical protein